MTSIVSNAVRQFRRKNSGKAIFPASPGIISSNSSRYAIYGTKQSFDPYKAKRQLNETCYLFKKCSVYTENCMDGSSMWLRDGNVADCIQYSRCTQKVHDSSERTNCDYYKNYSADCRILRVPCDAHGLNISVKITWSAKSILFESNRYNS